MNKFKKVVKKRRIKEKVLKRRKMNVPALGLEKHRLSPTGMPTSRDGTKEKIVDHLQQKKLIDGWKRLLTTSLKVSKTSLTLCLLLGMSLQLLILTQALKRLQLSRD